jgi:hypothetical protein
VALCVITLAIAFQSPGKAEAPGQALPYFTSYSVVGDYAIGNIDLSQTAPTEGFVNGTIDMNGLVPANADILAAFLYWQTITDGVDLPPLAKFRDQDIHSVSMSSAPSSFDNCWVPSNSSGAFTLTAQRADVLQLLPLEFDGPISTGRRLLTDLRVSLPDAGLDSSISPQTAGASLFVLFRDPDRTKDAKKVVVSDGLFVHKAGQDLEHTIRGFLDAKNGPVGKLSYIGGTAAPNDQDRIYFDGTNPLNGNGDLLTTDIGGVQNLQWSGPTFTGLALQNPPSDVYGERVITRVKHGGGNGSTHADCLTWSAIVFSAPFEDADKDGLPDRLEVTDNGSYSLMEPNDTELPNFNGMGASPTVPDIFIEVASMKSTAAETTYGSAAAPFKRNPDTGVVEIVSVTAGPHDHKPSPAALDMVRDKFAEMNIKVHFDVGNDLAYLSSPVNDNDLFVPASLARGGEFFIEEHCVESPGEYCQFPDYPGTVTWPTGVGLYKTLVFDESREDYFHFAVYAHAKGTRRSPFACLQPDLITPALPDAEGNCAPNLPHPDYRVPKGISGSAQYPGNTFLVTLGFFDNTTFVGTDFVTASTTMHELGHTLDLGHSGDALLPNCESNYLSVMNYLFQLAGLVDQDGVPHLGYSGRVDPDVDEETLSDTYSLPGPYRTSWYAPKLAGDTRAPAKRFCDGRKFPSGGWPDTVRIDGLASPTGSSIDWNGDGAFGFGMDASGTIQIASQDVNFNGGIDAEPFHGYNDWAAVRLNQIGSGHSFWGFSADSSKRWDGATIGNGVVTVGADGALGAVVTVGADGSIVTVGADGGPVTVGADGSVVTVGADGGPVTVGADGNIVTVGADGGPVTVGADGSVVTVGADGSIVTIGADGNIVTVGADGGPVTVGADGSIVTVGADGSIVTVGADGNIVTVGADGSGVGTVDSLTTNANLNELSRRDAEASGNNPSPTTLTACVIGVGGCVFPGTPTPPLVAQHRVRLDWGPPTAIVTEFSNYCGFRVVPGGSDKFVGATANLSQLSLVAAEELPYGRDFTYYVVGCNALPTPVTLTSQSNRRTITAVNDPPVAGTTAGLHLLNDNYVVYQVAVNTVAAAQGVLVNDAAGADSYPGALAAVAASITTGTGATVTLRADGSFDYRPALLGTSEYTDSFTYRATNGPWVDDPAVPLSVSSTGAVTVNLTVKPIGYSVTFPVPLKTTANLGSAVPAVVRAMDGSTVLSDTGIVLRIESARLPVVSGTTCPAISSPAWATAPLNLLYRNEPNTPGVEFSTGSSDLRYVASIPGFQFNWDTTGSQLGCHRVLFYFNDTNPDGSATPPRWTPTIVRIK